MVWSRRLLGVLLLAAVPVLAVVGVIAKSWSAGVAAAAVAVGGILATRGNGLWDQSLTEAKELAKAVRLTRRGRLPVIASLSDPLRWRVHPAEPVEGSRVPPFLDRDVVPEFETALAEHRFVLLVGESTAGKTRLAFETLRRLYPRHRLVEPSTRAGARAAARLAASRRDGVLWLDDVERFLGEEGLTRHDVDAVLARPGCRVVATIRAEEYARFGARPGIAAETSYVGGDVLQAAQRITVSRRWSATELTSAARHRDDQRVAGALAHAEEFGIAEWLAAGPQLLCAWVDAWAVGAHPRGAAIVAAAVDARRAGVHRPLSEELLRRLHEVYLEERGGQRLRPESFEDAMAWALSPLYATSSLLLPQGAGYAAFDYLLDAADKQPVPESALETLLDEADQGEAQRIGNLAQLSIQNEVATKAYERADKDHPHQFSAVGLLLFQGRYIQALTLAEAKLKSALAELGPDHMDSLRAEYIFGHVTGKTGNVRGAIRTLEDLRRRITQLHGPRNSLVWQCQMDIAHFTLVSGNHARCIAKLTEIVTDENHWYVDKPFMSIHTRCQLIDAHLSIGDAKTALTTSRVLLADLDSHSVDRDARCTAWWRLCWSLTAVGEHTEALSEWNKLTAETTRSLGAKHMVTMNARSDLADAIGKSGDAAEAVRRLREVVADWEKLDPGAGRRKQIHRSLLAYWERKNGDPTAATAVLRQVVTEMSETFDPIDPDLRQAQRELTVYEGEAANPATTTRPPSISPKH